jgi:V/A-type H+-transporting ATPase subunit A
MSEARTGFIREINGPILRIHLPGGRNGEQVRIGGLDIVGEIIALEGDDVIVQTYESSDGLRPGEEVEGLGHPLTVELGPGLLQGIFDGVQRPLQEIAALAGDNIPRGLRIPSLDRERAWAFAPNAERKDDGDVGPGTLLGTVQETETIEHRILVPPTLSGELIDLAPAGDYKLDKTIARVRDRKARCTN